MRTFGVNWSSFVDFGAKRDVFIRVVFGIRYYWAFETHDERRESGARRGVENGVGYGGGNAEEPPLQRLFWALASTCAPWGRFVSA